VSGLEISTKKRMVFAAGRSSSELAQEIATHLGITCAEVEIGDFANGEIYFRFAENVRGADVFVFQTHSDPINKQVMEQLIMIDAAKRASAKRISAVIPFYGYSRQDKKTRGREPITSRLVADILTVAGADRVLTVDLHTSQIQGFFDKPVDHLTALPLLADYLGDKFGDDLVIVSPDSGRVRVAEKFAGRLHAAVAFLHKRRRPDQRNVSETLEVVGEVAGKTLRPRGRHDRHRRHDHRRRRSAHGIRGRGGLRRRDPRHPVRPRDRPDQERTHQGSRRHQHAPHPRREAPR
jgi:ribose-phosphate pyrophosphokinase